MHPSRAIAGRLSGRLAGKTIVLGVTGSIAAVEAVKLARELIRHGASVVAVMTEGAQGLVHPEALHFAAGRPPITRLDGSVPYVALCGEHHEADLLLIAPASANTLAKMAHGISDSTVTTFASAALGSRMPVAVAPSMDSAMWANPAVEWSVKALRGRGVQVIAPLFEEGKAKMAAVETVVDATLRTLGPADLKGKRVVVIAGATAEPLDDVRVVTALSTGGTGIELAAEAYRRGADVALWLGHYTYPVPPALRPLRFSTVAELTALAENLDADYCLMPAAISDYSPRVTSGKIPSGKKGLSVSLKANPKVIQLIRKRFGGVLIGFKAESRVSPAELKRRALKRLKEAKLDFIVANDIRRVEVDRTEVAVIDKRGRSRTIAGEKAAVAEAVWGAILHGLSG